MKLGLVLVVEKEMKLFVVGERGERERERRVVDGKQEITVSQKNNNKKN